LRSTIVFSDPSQGASGIGLGNFQEIGPLDVDLKPRNSTWLQKADLIFLVSLGERQRQLCSGAPSSSTPPCCRDAYA
jgi:hypothetical protein